MDTASSQCRTPLGSSWTALLPGNSSEISRTGRYSLQIRRVQTRKLHLGKCSCVCIWRVRRIRQDRRNSGCGNRFRGCLQQSPVQAADGPAQSTWSRPNTDPAPGKNSGYAAWKLELFTSSFHNGHTTRITALAGPLQCLYHRPGRPEPKWAQQDSHTARWRVHIQNIKGLPGGNKWIVCPSGVTTPDLSSIQTRHKHCGARLTTEQQTNQYQQSHLMELLLNEHVTWDTLVSTLTECWPKENMWKQQHWSARKVSVLKAMECYLFLLYQRVVLGVIDYGLGLPTMAQINLLKSNRVQNEVMLVTLGTTKDTPIETMRFMLDLPPLQIRQKVEQMKAYFSVVESPYNPLHEAVKDTKGCRLARGKSWMGQAEDSILQVCQLTKLKQTKEWERYPNRFRRVYETLPPENVAKHCREWPAGKTESEI